MTEQAAQPFTIEEALRRAEADEKAAEQQLALDDCEPLAFGIAEEQRRTAATFRVYAQLLRQRAWWRDEIGAIEGAHKEDCADVGGEIHGCNILFDLRDVLRRDTEAHGALG